MISSTNSKLLDSKLPAVASIIESKDSCNRIYHAAKSCDAKKINEIKKTYALNIYPTYEHLGNLLKDSYSGNEYSFQTHKKYPAIAQLAFDNDVKAVNFLLPLGGSRYWASFGYGLRGRILEIKQLLLSAPDESEYAAILKGALKGYVLGEHFNDAFALFTDQLFELPSFIIDNPVMRFHMGYEFIKALAARKNKNNEIIINEKINAVLSTASNDQERNHWLTAQFFGLLQHTPISGVEKEETLKHLAEKIKRDKQVEILSQQIKPLLFSNRLPEALRIFCNTCIVNNLPMSEEKMLEEKMVAPVRLQRELVSCLQKNLFLVGIFDIKKTLKESKEYNNPSNKMSLLLKQQEKIPAREQSILEAEHFFNAGFIKEGYERVRTAYPQAVDFTLVHNDNLDRFVQIFVNNPHFNPFYFEQQMLKINEFYFNVNENVRIILAYLQQAMKYSRNFISYNTFAHLLRLVESPPKTTIESIIQHTVTLGLFKIANYYIGNKFPLPLYTKTITPNISLFRDLKLVENSDSKQLIASQLREEDVRNLTKFVGKLYINSHHLFIAEILKNNNLDANLITQFNAFQRVDFLNTVMQPFYISFNVARVLYVDSMWLWFTEAPRSLEGYGLNFLNIFHILTNYLIPTQLTAREICDILNRYRINNQRSTLLNLLSERNISLLPCILKFNQTSIPLTRKPEMLYDYSIAKDNKDEKTLAVNEADLLKTNLLEFIRRLSSLPLSERKKYSSNKRMGLAVAVATAINNIRNTQFIPPDLWISHKSFKLTFEGALVWLYLECFPEFAKLRDCQFKTKEITKEFLETLLIDIDVLAVSNDLIFNFFIEVYLYISTEFRSTLAGPVDNLLEKFSPFAIKNLKMSSSFEMENLKIFAPFEPVLEDFLFFLQKTRKNQLLVTDEKCITVDYLTQAAGLPIYNSMARYWLAYGLEILSSSGLTNPRLFFILTQYLFPLPGLDLKQMISLVNCYRISQQKETMLNLINGRRISLLSYIGNRNPKIFADGLCGYQKVLERNQNFLEKFRDPPSSVDAKMQQVQATKLIQGLQTLLSNQPMTNLSFAERRYQPRPRPYLEQKQYYQLNKTQLLNYCTLLRKTENELLESKELISVNSNGLPAISLQLLDADATLVWFYLSKFLYISDRPHDSIEAALQEVDVLTLSNHLIFNYFVDFYLQLFKDFKNFIDPFFSLEEMLILLAPNQIKATFVDEKNAGAIPAQIESWQLPGYTPSEISTFVREGLARFNAFASHTEKVRSIKKTPAQLIKHVEDLIKIPLESAIQQLSTFLMEQKALASSSQAFGLFPPFDYRFDVLDVLFNMLDKEMDPKKINPLLTLYLLIVKDIPPLAEKQLEDFGSLYQKYHDSPFISEDNKEYLRQLGVQWSLNAVPALDIDFNVSS